MERKKNFGGYAMILNTGLTQKYREEAQSIADEIYDKYGISCRIGISANELNNHIDKILDEVDNLSYDITLDKCFHGFVDGRYIDERPHFLLLNKDNIKKDLERFRVACNILHGEIKDPTVKFGANNI